MDYTDSMADLCYIKSNWDARERSFVMFRIFQEEKVITVCMLSFFAASILARLFLGWVYRSMIREADNMASTENKLLKQCKLKFANCYEMNNGVSNIPVFVDKFLNRLSLGPVSFETLYHLSGQAMLLSVVCAGIGICKGIVDGRMLGEILPFYIVSFLGLYLYFSISSVMDIKGKKRILKVNLVDYLENHLSARIDVTQRDMEMLYGARQYRGRSRRRRGTVELMPIGGRLLAEDTQSSGAYRQDTASYRQDTGTQPYRQETLPGRQDTDTYGRQDYRAEDVRVSEEELEALLKEFLG